MLSHDGPQETPSTGAGEPPSDPAMPVVPQAQLYNGSPNLLVDSGIRHSLGWQDHRTAGPSFVVVRLNQMGRIKVTGRFPLTEQGWAGAWRTLKDLDPAAATTVGKKLAQRAAFHNAASALEALDTESLASLAYVRFSGGSGAGHLDKDQAYDVRFLGDRLMICRSRSAAAVAEIPYRNVEAVEVSETRSGRSGGELAILILVLAVLGALLGLFVLGPVGMIVGALLFGVIAAVIGSALAGGETTVRVRSGDSELYFVQSDTRADAVRVALSEPLRAIDNARAAPAPGREHPAPPASVAGPDSVPDQLAKLASLLDQDLITREEFDRLKANVIARS